MNNNAPGWLDVFKSVLASFFGVQSEKNRKRDFTHGRPMQYIVVGLVLTGVLLLTVWGVVQWVLRSAGL